ncbi:MULTISPECIES: copper homeostasis periplasmic binding protein CopC [unclassified Sphingomonas]|uniref:copper homeostasis periplasmic binding protein CopC n=1 Tax=unclassified Sphingomonas TaxID=196159 RepID=UPI0006FFF189|nr:MULTISPECIES: copper homeostasis periplasmic binding protein CopC [unclassified Sphingomonas]KQX24141.1 copper resistance protein CopC [Sphingomonas sp. Root1294]KQY69685.1 copper resistance protein CopC [Sphingomonas sp. Root50]KRB93441.1 copper resistance protein CopC [Sphingomonas sp. Root720]
MAPFRNLMLAATVAAFTIASPALAHPKLVSATPAAGSTVSRPTQIALAFSETLMPQMSGLDLVMTGMPGMARHAPMKVAGFKTSVSQDGKTLVAALPKPLPAGTYDAHWHVVSTDTHRIEGHLTFTVR